MDAIELERQRRLSAVHEASHLVVWLMLGQRMEGQNDAVTIKPPNGKNGDWSWTFHAETKELARQSARDLAVALFAGHLGELTMDPDSSPYYGDDDRLHARKIIARYAPAENLPRLYEEAGDLVRRFQDIIWKFADELLKRETIPGLECEELFQELLRCVTH